MRCVGLTTLSLLCSGCLEIREPQRPGTIRTCPGTVIFCLFTLQDILQLVISGCEQPEITNTPQGTILYSDLVNKVNLVHNLFLVYCFLVYLPISTCFGRLCAHHPEKQLFLCDTLFHPAYQTVIHTE